MFVPFLAFTAIRLLITFGFPVTYKMTGFDTVPYLGYIEALSIVLSPGMLGTVAAFLMIDERDEKVYDLMSITPLGFKGYIINRLLMPFVLSFLYTFLCHAILNAYSISILQLSLTAIFSGIQGAVLGLILFSIADDKVKGLTYTKGISALMGTVASDLLGMGWLSIISSLFPYYWTSYIIRNPINPLCIFTAVAVHIIWLAAAVITASKRR
jgi:hypothetical protein